MVLLKLWDIQGDRRRTVPREEMAGKFHAMTLPKKSGFSLVELLVVSAIVAVLVGLAFPLLSRAMAASQRVKCLNNLRQIGVGMQSYIVDNQGMLPGPTIGGQNTYYNTYAMATYIYPYAGAGENTTKQARLFICPSWARNVSNSTSTSAICYVINVQFNIPGANAQYPFGYPNLSVPHNIAWLQAMNGSRVYRHLGGPIDTFSSAETWMISDADQLNQIYSGASWVGALPKTPVHLNVRNTLFFDFHAEPRSSTLIP